MQLSITRGRKTAPAVAAALITYALGLGLTEAGPARSIGGLCNGAPASHSWLDASGQPGPTLIEGTDGDDVIVGGDGDDNIDGGWRSGSNVELNDSTTYRRAIFVPRLYRP